MPQQQGQSSFDDDEIVTPAPKQSQEPIGARSTPGFDDDPVVPPPGDQPPPPPPAPNKPKEIPQMTEFGQTLWEEGVKGIPLGLYNTIRHPWDTAKEMGKAEWSEFTRAYDSAKEGHWWDAAGYTAAGLAPAVGAVFGGPAGALLGFGLGQGGSGLMEDVETGHYGRGMAHAVMLGAPELLRLAEIGPLVKAGRAGPEVERALQAEEKAGTVPFTTAQKQRNLKWQKREQMMGNLEGKAGEMATEAREKGIAGLRQRSEDLAGKVSPKVYDAEDAGNTVKTRLKTEAAQHKSTSKGYYTQVEAKTARATQRLQNGPRYQWLNPNTKQVQWVTPMKTFEAPIDIRSMQAQVRPVFDEYQHAWAQQPRLQASPGYQALQQLVHTKDWYMNAVDFDQTLSSIKSLTRDGTSKTLSTPSQRIAKIVIGAGEQELNKTFAAIDPTLKQTLQNARDSWRAYVDTAHLDDFLGENGGEAFKKLTKGGFGSLDEIREIKKIAPQELPNIARAHFQEMLSKATTMGGFDKTASLLNEWEKGTELKVRQELYGVQMESEIHDFLRAAKYLNPAEGSQTAGRFVAMKNFMESATGQGLKGAGIGIAFEMIGALATGHGGMMGPLIPLAAGAGAYLRTRTLPYIWAKMLFTPGGARLATKAITLPLGSKPWIRTMQIMGVRAMAIEQAHREDEHNKQKMAGAGGAPEGGRGGRPAETPTGGGRGAPPAQAAETPEKPSAVGPPAEAPEGQEAGPSQTPTRAPGTAAASGIQTPSATTVAGWPTGNVPPVMPSPQGGTRPQAAPPQFTPPAQGGAAVQPIPQSPTARGVPYQESAGGPPARAPIAGRGGARTPPARPPARPVGRPQAAGPTPNTRIYPAVARWQPTVQRIGQSMGVPPGLMSAIVQLESGGNPNARGTSGEIGLAQLMPATARALNVDPSNPEQALRGMATLLRHLMQKYRGDIAKVLAAYNEGETAFDRRMRKGLPLPDITQRYVRNGQALLSAGGQQVDIAVAGQAPAA